MDLVPRPNCSISLDAIGPFQNTVRHCLSFSVNSSLAWGRYQLCIYPQAPWKPGLMAYLEESLMASATITSGGSTSSIFPAAAFEARSFGHAICPPLLPKARH